MTTATNTGTLVDMLGDLRAEAADLKEQIATLETALKEQGAGTYEGEKFRATVSASERTTVGWKTVAERAGASRQLIAAHSVTKPFVALRVAARKK
jgi:hypothetical protein